LIALVYAKKHDASINLPAIFFYLIRKFPDELGDWANLLEVGRNKAAAIREKTK
jgi:hypothetical protein